MQLALKVLIWKNVAEDKSERWFDNNLGKIGKAVYLSEKEASGFYGPVEAESKIFSNLSKVKKYIDFEKLGESFKTSINNYEKSVFVDDFKHEADRVFVSGEEIPSFCKKALDNLRNLDANQFASQFDQAAAGIKDEFDDFVTKGIGFGNLSNKLDQVFTREEDQVVDEMHDIFTDYKEYLTDAGKEELGKLDQKIADIAEQGLKDADKAIKTGVKAGEKEFDSFIEDI